MFQIYISYIFVLVVLCIIFLALTTEPSFKRRVNKCEMLEYMTFSHHENLQEAEKYFGNVDCVGNEMDYVYNLFFWDYYDETTTPSSPSTAPLNTDPPNATAGTTIEPGRQQLALPELWVPKQYLVIMENVFTILFILDLCMRLFSCPSLSRYFLSFSNIVDILAVVCSILYFIIINTRKENKYIDGWAKHINYFQIIRTFRLFRVVKNVRASRVLSYSLRQNLNDMVLLVVLLLMGVSISANLIYLFESHDNIPSITEGWYWSLITITTVGYGDLTPQTSYGKVVASLLAMCGVLLLSVSLPMFVNNFLTLYQYSCLEDAIAEKEQEYNRKEEQRKGSIGTGKQTILNESNPTDFVYAMDKGDSKASKVFDNSRVVHIPGQVDHDNTATIGGGT